MPWFKTIQSVIFLLISLTFSYIPPVKAEQKTLAVAVNLGAPWAFYYEAKGVTGIDVEIIRQICQNLGYHTEFHVLAYNRLMEEYNLGKYDIASPVAFAFKTGQLTQKYLPFEDVAISLKTNNLMINTVSDLKDKKIIAYQHAKSILGKEFANTVAQTSYEEMGLRELQVKLLINKRVDIVIGERRVLSFIIDKLYPNTEIIEHRIFPIKSYGGIIRDAALAQKFDDELIRLKASGEFEKILTHDFK